MAKKRKIEQEGHKSLEDYSPASEVEKQLIQSFLKLKTEQEVSAYLRDLMTMREIKEFAARLEMARLLKSGHSYQEVADKLGVSTTTVTRTAHWLFHGCGGYQKILE